MFGLIKKIFIGLLTGLVNGSNHTKCLSLSNQKNMIQPVLIDLHPNEYNQLFYYYQFGVKLDRCMEDVILLITYLIKCMFQIKLRFKSKHVEHDYRKKSIKNSK